MRRHDLLKALECELRRLVSQWLSWREVSQGRSQGTIKNDRTSLERFSAWLAQQGSKLHRLDQVDREVLETYAVWLSVYEAEDGSSRMKAATRRRHLLSLKGFFSWLTEHGKLLADPARELVVPRYRRPLPRGILGLKEMMELIGSIDMGTALGLRDRSIVECLYGTGLRNSELRALELDDINFAEGLVTVRRGKGQKSRVVPLGRVASRYLKRYLEKARPELASVAHLRFEPTVFVSRHGRPLSSRGLEVIIARLARQAGFSKPLTPHGLRHTFATHLLRGRADIRHIQEMLGHKHLSSTEVYTHVAPIDLKRIHARCHPRERANRRRSSRS